MHIHTCLQRTHMHTHTHTQGAGPYTHQIKQTEDDIDACVKKVTELAGIKESDTGLAVPALWDLAADKQALQTEEPLQVRGGGSGWGGGGGGRGRGVVGLTLALFPAPLKNKNGSRDNI